MDQLVHMLQTQRDLQINSFGSDPCTLEGPAKVFFIRWNQQAANAELFEMLDETGWKVWATSRHVNADEAFKEMIDCWHFFMNILLAIYGEEIEKYGMQWLADQFTEQYLAKKEVNAKRQTDGYDGIFGKCPACHRDRKETEKVSLANGWRTVYCICGHIWENVLL